MVLNCHRSAGYAGIEACGPKNAFKPDIVEPTLLGVSLRQSERSYQYLIVIGDDRAFLEKSPGLLDCCDRIPG
jgi:hypothetical protein